MGVPSFQRGHLQARHPAAGSRSRGAGVRPGAMIAGGGTGHRGQVRRSNGAAPKKKRPPPPQLVASTERTVETLGFGGVDFWMRRSTSAACSHAPPEGGGGARRSGSSACARYRRRRRKRRRRRERGRGRPRFRRRKTSARVWIPSCPGSGRRLPIVSNKTRRARIIRSVGAPARPAARRAGTTGEEARACYCDGRRRSGRARPAVVGGQKAHGAFRRPNSSSDWSRAPTSAAAGTTIGAEREREPNASAGEASQNQGIGIVPLENRREPFSAGSAATAATVSKLDRTTRAVGPADDHIGAGSVTPLLASDVKLRAGARRRRAPRARHRRQRSAESGGRGSGSNPQLQLTLALTPRLVPRPVLDGHEEWLAERRRRRFRRRQDQDHLGRLSPGSLRGERGVLRRVGRERGRDARTSPSTTTGGPG